LSLSLCWQAGVAPVNSDAVVAAAAAACMATAALDIYSTLALD
jgi:hypothetical protein